MPNKTNHLNDGSGLLLLNGTRRHLPPGDYVRGTFNRAIFATLGEDLDAQKRNPPTGHFEMHYQFRTMQGAIDYANFMNRTPRRAAPPPLTPIIGLGGRSVLLVGKHGTWQFGETYFSDSFTAKGGTETPPGHNAHLLISD